MREGTGVTAEALENAILRETEGGPTTKINLYHEDGWDDDWDAAYEKFRKEHPEAVSIDYDDHGPYAIVPVQPCPEWVTMYIAVDQLGRNYGGPEEGGWWYDSGDVVHTEAIRVFFKEDRTPHLKDEERKFLGKVAEKLSEEFSFGTNHRSSMRPRGSDFSWRIEWDPPQDWPRYKPHYE